MKKDKIAKLILYYHIKQAKLLWRPNKTDTDTVLDALNEFGLRLIQYFNADCIQFRDSSEKVKSLQEIVIEQNTQIYVTPVNGKRHLEGSTCNLNCCQITFQSRETILISSKGKLKPRKHTRQRAMTPQIKIIPPQPQKKRVTINLSYINTNPQSCDTCSTKPNTNTNLHPSQNSATQSISSQFSSVASPDQAKYSMEEVKRHNQKNDAWVVINGLVYDITEIIFKHPGGPRIMTCLGRDASKAFDRFHKSSALELLAEYCIGRLIQKRYQVSF